MSRVEDGGPLRTGAAGSRVIHRLDPSPDTVTDVFSRDLTPVLTIDPGDTLVVHSLDASGYLRRQRTPGEQAPRLLEAGRGHCLAGPVAVRGVEAGDVLAVELVSVVPDSWGWTVAGGRDTPLNRRLDIDCTDPTWLLWDIDVANRTATDDRGHTVGLRPFLGVIGLPPAAPGEHSTIPPRTEGGGNIDCRELIAGSTLHLPVTVPGALLCLGDGHGAQGDGEVSGTAVECGMTTELVVGVDADPALRSIHAVTPTARITFGFAPALDDAMADALGAMVTWMERLFGLDRPAALALASPTVDLRVTQVANQTWGVHAVLAHDAVRGAVPA